MPLAASPRASRAQVRCLVVHDDLELRLRLASLVRRAIPTLDADCINGESFDAMTSERLAQYAALLLVVEFNLRDPLADPLSRLALARERSPRLPILVFARGGDERNAALTIKRGANDYWPVHSVKIGELTLALQPALEPTASNEPEAVHVTTMTIDPGQRPHIGGYFPVKTLAESSGSIVYLARKNDLSQPVALKVQPLKGRAPLPQADLQRFARECELLSSLNHRAIGGLQDFGVTDEYLYLAQEYFPRRSLRERLKKPLSEADAVHYARRIGTALSVAHDAGVVHRNLKPSNIMLTDDEQLVLIDFGSAALGLGTAPTAYSSPEQLVGHEPDARADLYSLGLVLYEMLVGELPGATLPRLPQRVLRYQPLIERLLTQEPADRYPSAAIFLDDLSAVSAPLRTASE